MQAGQPIYADCKLGWGRTVNPTNTNLGISEPEAEYLGRYYWSKGPDGKMRVIKIVRNNTGSTLTARQICKYVTTAGRWGLDVTPTTDDTDPFAGVVEEGYSGGVATGLWFRLVVWAEYMKLYLQTTSSSRCTIANGGLIVAADDDGTFFGQNSSASNNAVQNAFGHVLQATTNATDNGTLIPCKIAPLRI